MSNLEQEISAEALAASTSMTGATSLALDSIMMIAKAVTVITGSVITGVITDALITRAIIALYFDAILTSHLMGNSLLSAPEPITSIAARVTGLASGLAVVYAAYTDSAIETLTTGVAAVTDIANTVEKPIIVVSLSFVSACILLGVGQIAALVLGAQSAYVALMLSSIVVTTVVTAVAFTAHTAKSNCTVPAQIIPLGLPSDEAISLSSMPIADSMDTAESNTQPLEAAVVTEPEAANNNDL